MTVQEFIKESHIIMYIFFLNKLNYIKKLKSI